MSLSTSRRLYHRARRVLRQRWLGVSVAFTGNAIPRQCNFSVAIPHPILILQGFGTTRRGLLILEQRLRRDGYHVFSLRLGGLFGTLNTRTIDALARHVGEKIASLRRRYRLGKVTIIGHSKGGLVGRYLVACLGGAEHCDRLITLGTPHQGYPTRQIMRVAALGLVMPSIRQMRPTSRLFRLLQEAGPLEEIECVSIYSTADHIAPAQYCHWRGNEHWAPHNIVLAGLSHSDYLIKQRAYEALVQFLPK
ncbi:MAG: hypothetical protein HYV02_04065 [Deltaproteobacteria bacterium]|nr:hypothetical protein [Deltaproteobacteria bacterium]